MDKAAMTKAMMASISEVLEQMFFLPIVMVAAEDQPKPKTADAHTISAKVGFEGAPSGTFQLNVPEDLATSITADFLGTEADQLSMEQITGTVKEMINMLAGNSLCAYDAKSPYDLQIPQLAESEHSDGTENMSNGHDIRLDIETLDSRMTLHMAAQAPDEV